MGKTLVFVGYSLKDDNFLAILDDVREVLDTKSLPWSFAVREGFRPTEEAFWREKYNIQLIDSDAYEFLTALKDSWFAENRVVIPLHQRASTEFLSVDESTRFPRVGDSYYRVAAKDCTGPSNPELFFRGGPFSWSDARDKVAPNRSDYWTLMEGLFADLVEPTCPPTVYLITGPAGTGKTTLVRSAAFDVAREFDVPVLVHVPGTPLDARLLGGLTDEKNPKRIVLVVHRAADYIKELERFIEDVRRLKLPVSIVLEERKNQWITAASTIAKKLSPAEIDLGPVTEEEIDEILDALDRFHCLGKLTGTPRDYQRSHFVQLAHKELLVALRELTSPNQNFDDIVRDEYDKIPSDVAKQAYLYVSALGQVNLYLRYEHLIRILNLRHDQLGTEVFRPTDGVLVQGLASGSSRHNLGFRVETRHPIIASIIFAAGASTDRDKFDILNAIITHLDPGYIEDRKLLEEIVRHREIVRTLADPALQRAIYDRLAQVLPANAYVSQHRSILERELDDADAAIKFAREAVTLERYNPALQNTLGMALEFAARTVPDALRRQAYVKEAGRIFEDGIRRNPTDAYPYVGKLNLMRQQIASAPTNQEAILSRAQALAMLEEAYEATYHSHIIASLLAEERRALGEPEEAARIIDTAIQMKPADSRLRSIQIDLLTKKGKLNEALQAALLGISFDPTAWRIQRYAARLMRQTGYAIEAVRGHYDTALRHNRGDVGLMVELGAFLFMNGLEREAYSVFAQAKELPVPLNEKRSIREWWTDERKQRVVFAGTVKSIRGASAFVLAIPQNFTAFFWRTHTALVELKEGDPVKFSVGFNAFGATARVS